MNPVRTLGLDQKFIITVECLPITGKWSGSVPTAGLCCLADTPEAAAKEIHEELLAYLEDAYAEGRLIPEKGCDMHELSNLTRRFICISKLAKMARVNRSSLASRIERKTPLPTHEAKRVRQVLHRLAMCAARV